MEVNFNTNANTGSHSPQQTNNTASNHNSNTGSVETVQKTLDNVVVSTKNIDESSLNNDNSSGAGASLSAIPSIENIQIDGVTARVGYDIETDLVYLEILQPKTEDVISRFPSESLVEYLNARIDSQTVKFIEPKQSSSLA